MSQDEKKMKKEQAERLDWFVSKHLKLLQWEAAEVLSLGYQTTYYNYKAGTRYVPLPVRDKLYVLGLEPKWFERGLGRRLDPDVTLPEPRVGETRIAALKRFLS